LIFSTVLIVLTGDIENQWELISVHLLIFLLVSVLIYYDSLSKQAFIAFLRSIYPIILSGYFYSETVFYNKLLFQNIDPFLVKIEDAIFAMQPSIEFSSYISNKLYSELMYFGYFSFYLLILAFVLYAFYKRKEYYHQAIFKLSISMYLFYLLFSLIPSMGPQFYFSAPENTLPDAYFFDHIMHFIQAVAEQPTGAFPSSHVGISVIILMLSRKNVPVFFKIAWPFVLLIILSTVYIKAHYAIDIIGGLLIAPFILYLSNILYKFPAKESQIKEPNA